MPSVSYKEWLTTRTIALDAFEQAHVAIVGKGRGRRFATHQINQAFAVFVASQFQGFCRDLHTESVEHLLASLSPPVPMRPILQAEFTRGRQLERSNAQPGSIGSDFGRLGIDFWKMVEGHDPRNSTRKARLEDLNKWRNAIAHQDFDPNKLGGTTTLHLVLVRRWRGTCRGLASSFDQVISHYLRALTGTSPW